MLSPHLQHKSWVFVSLHQSKSCRAPCIHIPRVVNNHSYTEPLLCRVSPTTTLSLRRKETPFWFKYKGTGWGQFLDMVIESELKSYGVVVNSFYNMEPA
ncbi:hypothetical protein ACSBR2_007834 [Camellia fascicularis]